jgi:hypothetical protein
MGFWWGDVMEIDHLEDLNVNERIILQDGHCMYNVTLRQIHATTVAVEKSISITYSE